MPFSRDYFTYGVSRTLSLSLLQNNSALTAPCCLENGPMSGLQDDSWLSPNPAVMVSDWALHPLCDTVPSPLQDSRSTSTIRRGSR